MTIRLLRPLQICTSARVILTTSNFSDMIFSGGNENEGGPRKSRYQVVRVFFTVITIRTLVVRVFVFSCCFFVSLSLFQLKSTARIQKNLVAKVHTEIRREEKRSTYAHGRLSTTVQYPYVFSLTFEFLIATRCTGTTTRTVSYHHISEWRCRWSPVQPWPYLVVVFLSIRSVRVQ